MEMIEDQHATAPPLAEDEERSAFVKLDPAGFFIRHPPPPHELDSFITDDDSLFQTIHMGAAVVDESKWRLVVSGLVSNPFSLTLGQLRNFPSETITAFMECYGSPLVPPTKALRRIGNVTWTGVPLSTLLSQAQPHESGSYVWTTGLDRGAFANVSADRYQKDLPISKAMNPELLVAYAMNGEPLSKNRGGPVRLVVPGWFGTNSTKWLCKIEVQDRRAPGPFTMTFYNEKYPPDDPLNPSKPVFGVQPNSMIVRPQPDAKVAGPEVAVEGCAWSEDEVEAVGVSADEGQSWVVAELKDREGFSWQRFRAELKLNKGRHTLLARSKGRDGRMQPLGEARNHVHRVEIEVV
ncbi:uncharacterized protein LTR77_010306 [Saxophila tyrrhenica]|uniref:Sulfite oxidase n=1 Tax=Saxophila tyrrhenica TaxID=1690608 RepID=A0AAV9NYG8_9PEZI|nr:hypothetical protein LTR77_010306 [Saxophila tyrrhenica]